MIRRFALYGFLKNQQYFEPFLFLVFLEKGLGFFQIGILIGFRELCVNLMEIPSGAAADLYGRRRAMILSFACFIGSFVLFATAGSLPALFAAMFLFSVGEAFRTGTHKAMILDWLNLHGRGEERTRVYGYTRSWSKAGSALSALIAGGLVFWTGRYSTVFWFSIPPYLLGMVNFFGYDPILDRRPEGQVSARKAARHLLESLRISWENRGLRRLMVEAAAYGGSFRSGKDYLQPVLKQVALALPLFTSLGENRRGAILIGVVYAFLYLFSSLAARQSHRFAAWFGGEERGSRFLWLLVLGVYLLMIPAFPLGWTSWMVASFLVLAAAQNIWRPLMISRFHKEAPAGREATILSVESQSRSLATMLLAPLLGFLVDQVGFSVIGGMGGVLAAVILATYQGGQGGRENVDDPS